MSRMRPLAQIDRTGRCPVAEYGSTEYGNAAGASVALRTNGAPHFNCRWAQGRQATAGAGPALENTEPATPQETVLEHVARLAIE